jgi:hypothetical protein
LVTSDGIGLRKSIASSAYKLVQNLMGSTPIGVSRPCCIAMSSSLYRGSIANINNIGESESPCRRPRPCFMGRPSIPLSIICDEVVLQISVIKSLQCCPNPNCCRTSSKYSQRTLSNAFAMSNFNSSIGVLA